MLEPAPKYISISGKVAALAASLYFGHLAGTAAKNYVEAWQKGDQTGKKVYRVPTAEELLARGHNLSASEGLRRLSNGQPTGTQLPPPKTIAQRIYGPPDQSYLKFPLPERPKSQQAQATSSASQPGAARTATTVVMPPGFNWPWGMSAAGQEQTLSTQFGWPWGELAHPQTLMNVPGFYLPWADMFPIRELPAPLPKPSAESLELAKSLANLDQHPLPPRQGPKPAVDLGF